ncbi:transmembrane protein [Myxozyma melibiosi]|uniref:Store-operated calcium entry-associated regulatory factor n=1 Tax=Myxozyma melibiosi TaxID=54550 RepID=A0ABR1F7D5_9ASCO
MRITKANTISLLCLVLCILPAVASARPDSPSPKILPSQIQTLTLRKDAKTKGRRTKPVPQLKQVGGDAKGLYEVPVMQCRNMGAGDGGPEDVQWSCTADLPGYFKLGSTDVICEGYNNADDPYVLKGSCGVEYTLYLTESGYQRYGKSPGSIPYSTYSDNDGSSLTTLFWFLAACALLYAVSIYFSNPTPPGTSAPPRRRRNNFFGTFSSGDNDDDNDPPPPYSGGGGGGSGKYFSTAQRQQQHQWRQTQQDSWRPGFWTGLGAGAVGAGLYNRFTNPSRTTTEQRANFFRERALYDDYEPPLARRGGGGGGFMRSSSGGSGGFEEAPTRESTGFGGTRRR